MSLAGLAAVLFTGVTVTAHPGPHHDVERLTAAITREPENAELYIERARNYRLDGQFAESLSDCDRARSLNPENREVYLELGLTLSAMGRDTRAEDELTRYCESGTPTFEALAERGRIRERDGRGPLALADYAAAIALDGRVQLYLDRGRLQESLGLLDDAARGYREGLAHRQGATNLRMALIRVEVARKQYDAALELIDESLGRSAVKTHWHLQRAEVFDAAGDVQRARRERMQGLVEADRVLKKNNSSLNLYSRAQVYVALGRIADARRDLVHLLEESPRFTAARELLDQLDIGQGR